MGVEIKYRIVDEAEDVRIVEVVVEIKYEDGEKEEYIFRRVLVEKEEEIYIFKYENDPYEGDYFSFVVEPKYIDIEKMARNILYDKILELANSDEIIYQKANAILRKLEK